MNAAGIDVSSRKSTVAVLRPFGEVVRLPFDVSHSSEDLAGLARQLKALDGETRVVMEHTGRYYEPVANVLHEAGLHVSAVNPLLIREYGGNSLRRVKTDKADAVKIARYALDKMTTKENQSGSGNINWLQFLFQYTMQVPEQPLFFLTLYCHQTSLVPPQYNRV